MSSKTASSSPVPTLMMWQFSAKTGRSIVLGQVFGHLEAAGLTVKLCKCRFGGTQVPYLGHVVGGGSLQPEANKVLAAKEYPRLVTKTDVWPFLGFVGYYHRVIANFVSVVAPLTDPTRKGQPHQGDWEDKQEVAFQQLKHHVTSAPVLWVADPLSPTSFRQMLLTWPWSCPQPGGWAGRGALPVANSCPVRWGTQWLRQSAWQWCGLFSSSMYTWMDDLSPSRQTISHSPGYRGWRIRTQESLDGPLPFNRTVSLWPSHGDSQQQRQWAVTWSSPHWLRNDSPAVLVNLWLSS